MQIKWKKIFFSTFLVFFSPALLTTTTIPSSNLTRI
ncbi:unnamed protein product [Brassica oleracea]